MVIGDPFRFGFILDHVPVWSSDGFIACVFIMCIEEEMFPKKLANTTMNSDLYHFFGSDPSALVSQPVNQELFHADKREAFMRMFDLYAPGTFYDVEDWDAVDNDYTYLASTLTMTDDRSYVFAVSDGERVRVLGAEMIFGRDENDTETCTVSDVINEYILPKEELNQYVGELKNEYERISRLYLKAR
jgi:hypothetical protein